MEELQSNEILNDVSKIDDNIECISADENSYDSSNTESTSTDMIEYKEVDEPCVALTIIGENRLTNAEIFVKRGFKFSIKAFFSTLVLTIMNMFI